ncbi:MAG: AAA domain-containing protein [Ignavibacteriales bacterium]|nr:AAA domain-containing protein [Ignavibacteriales bacterium]
MSSPATGSTESFLFAQPAQALREERAKLQSARTEIILFGGEQVGSMAGFFYYRFELPEDLALRPVDRVSCSFNQLQPVTMDGRIVGFENQYIVIALPMDFGPLLPEIKCKWSYDDHLPFVADMLAAVRAEHPVSSVLLHPEGSGNTHTASPEPVQVPNVPAEVTEVAKKILQNRVSYLWGPVRSGKTSTLALIALSYLKAGKSVLLTATTTLQTDQLLLKTLALARDAGIDLNGLTSRVGLPAYPSAAVLAPVSFENEVETKRTDKKKQLEERVALLRSYWKTKIHQYLHDDYYTRLTELRERTNESRKQLEKLRDETAALKEIITRAQNASMMEKFKKGFSKEEAAAAQKQLTEKLMLMKKLQPVQQALTTELMRVESQAPIESGELKEYQVAVRRLGELGGIKNVTDEVDNLSAVDETALVSTKRCVAASLTWFFSDQRVRDRNFDLILVDDAERVAPAYLAALSAKATAAMVIAGDPFQPGPESFSKSDLAEEWIQQDIFLKIAQTEQLNQLHEWTQKNPTWCFQLMAHVATALKLSRFVSAFFFDNKLQVQERPGTGGAIVVLDTSDAKSTCRQYLGKKSLIPFNDVQTKRTMDVVKHALARGQRRASDVGIIVPFPGTTLYTKLQLRLQGIRNVEVGTPATYFGRRKKVIIFDLSMAGVDYTMRYLDDRKIGEHRLARFLNSVLSCVEEDLYVVADMGHFKTVYRDRLITKFLMLLQAQSSAAPPLSASAKTFDDMSWDVREKLLSPAAGGPGAAAEKKQADSPASAQDVELDVRMKMMAKLQPQQVFTGRDFDQEIYLAAHRVLGLRKDANLLSQYLGGDLLFRYSIGTELAAARLPLDGCRNEDEFRKTMERWNLLVYEMSGAGKTDLSFFAKQTPEARVRWDINNLRAYYSSAMEAVVEESKHRIATSVSKVFQECLGKNQPANPIEWSTAYLNFLGKMEAYLAWISEQLRH